MQKPVQKTKSAGRKPRNPLKIVIICGVIVLALVLVDTLTFVGGNIRFYVKWAECGERPYYGYTPFGSYISRYEPGPVFTLFRQGETFYCNPLEAEKAGISASSERYEFPILDAQGIPWPRLPGTPPL